MALFKRIWEKDELNDKELQKARRAIAKISDQIILRNIAIGKGDWKIKLEAIHLITDQDILRYIAIGEYDWKIKLEAVHLITEQNILRDIAAGKGDWKIKCEAVRLITDQQTLAYLACLHTDTNVRFAALERIWDRDQLVCVAIEASWMQSNDGNHPINNAALGKLPQDDYEAFSAIARDCAIEEVRLNAARRAGNNPLIQAFWKDVFWNKKPLPLRLEAVEHMGEQTRLDAAVQKELMNIIKKTTFNLSSLRVRASELLSDPVKSKQYAIASRLVGLSYCSDQRYKLASLDFKYITDPEVIDFVLENKMPKGEFGDKALELLYENIDPNSERAYRVLSKAYNRRYLVRDEMEITKVLNSPEWCLLKHVTDLDMLRRLAKNKDALSYIRFQACEMAGGHKFVDENCKCVVCGFENHHFKSMATGSVCKKCGSEIAHVVYGGGDLWTTYDQIEHTNGTVTSMACIHWKNARKTLNSSLMRDE